jgi:parvulin-like peptidyl-prolyl isomerase
MSARRWLMSSLAGATLLAGAGGRAAAQAPPAPAGQATAAAGTAAVVNGETISMADVEKAVKQFGPSPTPLPEATRREQMRDALASLIDSVLIDQFLRTNSAPVPPAGVEQKMAELAAKLKEEKKTVAEFCTLTGQTEVDLRKGIERVLRWEGYVAARGTDAELQRYHAQNKDFFDGVHVRASHIFVAVPPNMPQAEVEKLAAQLAALKADVVAGKITFEEAAKKYSQCPVTAPNGGDRGYFTRKLMVEEEFARAAFALPVNQVSEVVRTGLGLHLIKVTDRKPGKQPSDFNTAKDDVRFLYGAELYESVLTQLRQAAKLDVRLP